MEGKERDIDDSAAENREDGLETPRGSMAGFSLPDMLGENGARRPQGGRPMSSAARVAAATRFTSRSSKWLRVSGGPRNPESCQAPTERAENESRRLPQEKGIKRFPRKPKAHSRSCKVGVLMLLPLLRRRKIRILMRVAKQISSCALAVLEEASCSVSPCSDQSRIAACEPV